MSVIILPNTLQLLPQGFIDHLMGDELTEVKTIQTDEGKLSYLVLKDEEDEKN